MQTQSKSHGAVAPQSNMSPTSKARVEPDDTLRFSSDILKALDRVLGPR